MNDALLVCRLVRLLACLRARLFGVRLFVYTDKKFIVSSKGQRHWLKANLSKYLIEHVVYQENRWFFHWELTTLRDLREVNFSLGKTLFYDIAESCSKTL